MQSNELISKFLNIFYNLLYHQFAWSYDLVSWLVSVGQWNQWVKEVIPFFGDGSVLEIGIGPGHLQSLSHELDINIFGIDLSPQMSKLSQNRLFSAGHDPQILTASGEKIPFKSEVFSTITATFPAEFIVTQETLSEIYRTLQPQGKFILLPAAWNTGKSILHRFTTLLFKITGQIPPQNTLGIKSEYQFLRQAGFEFKAHLINLKNSKVLILEATK